MNLVSYAKATLRVYQITLTDYYKEEGSLRILHIFAYFIPSTAPYCHRIVAFFKGRQLDLLTDENLQKPQWAKLRKVIDEVKGLYAIKGEIRIAKDLSGEIEDYALTDNIIIVNEERLSGSSDDAQKFAIAHELAHYIHRHLAKRNYLDCLWVVVDLSCVALACYKSRLYFLAWGVAELTIFHIDRAISRAREKEADLTAIKILRSSKGAREAFITDLMLSAAEYMKEHNLLLPEGLSDSEFTEELLTVGIQLDRLIVGRASLSHSTSLTRLKYSKLDEELEEL
ncbi:MAG: M48 family metalloprotease [Chlamydiales bacterium]|nr:M48 family metallopeptidase [Chlamydiales bacterium]NCF70721.1 M48 family metalloprotease [Chlamydiales bacterium]